MTKTNVIFSEAFSEYRADSSEKAAGMSGLKHQPKCNGLTRKGQKCQGVASSNGLCKHHGGVKKPSVSSDPHLESLLKELHKQGAKIYDDILASPPLYEQPTKQQQEEREQQRRAIEGLDVRDVIIDTLKTNKLLAIEALKILLNPKTKPHHKITAIRLASELELNQTKILKMTGFLTNQEADFSVTAKPEVDLVAMYETLLEETAESNEIKDESLRQRTMAELDASRTMAKAANAKKQNRKNPANP